jgi:hypothetical protein
MALRDALQRLKKEIRPFKRTLVCPECDEKFVVYGIEPYDPTVNYLHYVWQTGPHGAPYQGPPEDIRRVVEHEHDPCEFLDTATGERWLGAFFRDMAELERRREDIPDLSEQAQEK